MWARARGGPGGAQEGGGGLLVGGREERGGSGGWRTAGTSTLGSSVQGVAARVGMFKQQYEVVGICLPI